jgi:hypothetical protein
MKVVGIRADGRRIEMEREDIGLVKCDDGNFFRFHYAGALDDKIIDHNIEISVHIVNRHGGKRLAYEEKLGVLGMGFVEVEGLPC